MRLDHNNLKEISPINIFNGTTDLEILSLTHNKIRKIRQEMPETMLRELDLRHNNISRFYLANFINNTKSSHLNIQIGNNPLESVDFYKVEGCLISNNLTITVDVGVTPFTCNCHTISFHEFLTKKIFKNTELYDRVDVIPDEINCKQDELEKNFFEIQKLDTKRMICSLDNDHQNLCPKKCECIKKVNLFFFL